jgi:uncharacterized membrane protein
MTAASWHFLGWALVLVGSSGWTSGRLPHLLSALYVVTGISSLFVYLLPNADATAGALGVIVSIWQGILLWRTKPQETQAPEINSSQPEKA